MGSLGAATVTTVVGGVGALVAMVTLQRLWEVRVPTATLARSLLISAGAFFLAAAWPATGFLFLTLKLSAIGLAVLFGFFAFGEFNLAELAALRAMFRAQGALNQDRSSF